MTALEPASRLLWEKSMLPVEQGNCSQGGQALETAKNGPPRPGAPQWVSHFTIKNIQIVTYLVVIYLLFQGFLPFSLENLSVRGVNSYDRVKLFV